MAWMKMKPRLRKKSLEEPDSHPESFSSEIKEKWLLSVENKRLLTINSASKSIPLALRAAPIKSNPSSMANHPENNFR